MLAGFPGHPVAACFFCTKGRLAAHAAVTVHAAAATAHTAGGGLGAVVGGDAAAVVGVGPVRVDGGVSVAAAAELQRERCVVTPVLGAKTKTPRSF